MKTVVTRIIEVFIQVVLWDSPAIALALRLAMPWLVAMVILAGYASLGLAILVVCTAIVILGPGD